MTIKIGGEHFVFTTSFDKQIDVRDAEKAANGLFEEYRRKFPMASSAALLARVAFTLAASYLDFFDINNAALDLAQKADSRIQEILESGI